MSSLLSIGGSDAFDGEVVRLGGATRPYDLGGLTPKEVGDLDAGLLHRLLGRPAKLVIAGGRVAEVLGKVGTHRLEDLGGHGGRRVVVHIDREGDGRGLHDAAIRACIGRGTSFIEVIVSHRQQTSLDGFSGHPLHTCRISMVRLIDSCV